MVENIESELIIDTFDKKIANTFYALYEVEEELEVFLNPYVEDVIELKIGFNEILVNAVEHGNELDPDRKIRVKAIITEEDIKLVIEDQGKGFEWQDKVMKDLELDYDDPNERGRGINIAKKIYNKIKYNDQGNKVCLVKSR